MQGILFFCTITGLVFCTVVLMDFLSMDRPVRYDCSMAEFHPDMPIKAREQCRLLRSHKI